VPGYEDCYIRDCHHVLRHLQNPDKTNPGNIVRTQRAEAQPKDLSRFSQSTLSQGAMEQILLDYLGSRNKLQVEWDTSLESLSIDNDLCDKTEAFPVTAMLRKSGGAEDITVSEHD
jgi:phenol 2-monooxygenase